MTGPDREELPADVREFLVELSKALQQVGFYPEGHPSLDPLVEGVHDGLGRLLEEREVLSLAVSPDVLVTEDGESDPDHPALRGLARRLHEHELAHVAFHPLPDRDEVAGFLRTVSDRAEGEEGPLGTRRNAGAAWSHIDLEPATYDHLALTEEAEAEEAAVEEVEGEAEELWIGLARATLAEASLEEVEGERPEVDRLVVALERYSADQARARTIAARLLDVARKLQQEGPDAAPEVRDDLVELMEETEPDALGRIFSSAPPSVGQAFLQATAEWMPVDTVLETVEQLSGGRELSVSYHMLRLLSKLASFVHAGEEGRDPEAEQAFREQVRSLVGGWQENIRAPEGEDARLPGPLERGDDHLETTRQLVDAERVVQTALELDHLGPTGERAVEELLGAGGLMTLLRMLREAPPGDDARLAVWRRVGSAESLRHILREDPPDYEALDEMLDHLGGRAAGVLLDALAESGSRSVRRQLFSRLTEMEDDIQEEILDRLDDDRWFVQRNMLALLAERGELPDGFSPLRYTAHDRAAVRREAHRLALRHDGERTEAVRRGMDDDDPKVLSLAFGALERLPDEEVAAVTSTLVERVQDDELSAEQRRPGIRALGRVDRPRARRLLLSLCRTRRFWTFWRTSLADPGPLMLEALRALASGWSDHPEVRDLLEEARDSDDPEVREAAAPGGAPGAGAAGNEAGGGRALEEGGAR